MDRSDWSRIARQGSAAERSRWGDLLRRGLGRGARVAFVLVMPTDRENPPETPWGIGLAVEDEAGYWPMHELGSFATRPEGQEFVAQLNETCFGVGAEEAAHIVLTSLSRGNLRD